MSASDQPDDRRLWYRSPAEDWVDALPVGSGRLGAMVFGRPDRARLQLNEEHLWAGAPIERHRELASERLPEVRERLLEGDHEGAHELADEALLGEPRRLRPYQAFGTLDIDLPGHEDCTDYRRELDLATAIATVRYTVGETRYERSAFASAVDDVVVVRIEADGPAGINAQVRLDREQDARTAVDGETLVCRGQILTLPEDEHGEGEWGLRFEGRATVRAVGGTVEPDEDASAVVVRDAETMTVCVAAATSHTHPDPTAATRADLAAVEDREYADMRDDHVADHAEYFDRVTIDLGARRDRPTDVRLAAVEDGIEDPDLAALYFQYARYLLISSSRPGGLPANLQGLWCGEMEPPWNSGFTTNLNLQMNYWSAEVANLPECTEPLHELIDSLRPSGRKTARAHYDCEGWCVHHNTDLWRSTTPVDGVWGIWPLAGAWLCRHLWEHFAYSRDRGFLRETAYPIMKEAARFALDYLVDDDGELVTAPSVSPENIFVGPDGFEGWLCVAPTIDIQLLDELFRHCEEAAEILDRDPSFREEVAIARAALPEMQIADDGRLQEWREDYEEHYPGHRHLSHLYACYPGDGITPRETPELADAVRRSIEYRLDHGSGSTGWSQAWLINQFARLRDPSAAARHVRTLLGEYTADSMLDLHPPFQIDGNFGGAAGIAELLVQSHEDEIALIPALPTAWETGSVSGLRARGGFEISIRWSDGSPDGATVHSTAGRRCRLRLPTPVSRDVTVRTADGASPELRRPTDDLLVFDTHAGERYHIDV